MAKLIRIPENADFYYNLAVKQKDNLEFYDAIINLNEAIKIEEREEFYSLKAEILALNDDEIQSNELYFYVQNRFEIDKSIAIASNFIRFNREDLIQYYFKRGIEKVIDLGSAGENDSNQNMLKYLIKDIDKIKYVSEEEFEATQEQQQVQLKDLPSFDKYEPIIDIERENFINTKERREAMAFAKMLTLLDLSDYEGSVRESEIIPPDSKYYQDALELKMNAMLCLEDLKGALSCAEKLAELAPCNVSMFTVYACVYDEIYEKDISKKINEKAQKALDILVYNEEYDEIFDIAEIFFDNNAFPLSVKFLEKYLAVNDVREEALLMQGVALYALNRPDECRKYLKRASDLYGLHTYALTILELLESDFEVEDYSLIFNELPSKWVNYKINALINKFNGYLKGYLELKEEIFVREVFSIAKLVNFCDIAPLIDNLTSNLDSVMASKIIDLILISDLVVWDDNKSSIIESIINNVNEKKEYFKGAIVNNGLYSEIKIPLKLKIELESKRNAYKDYYKKALVSIIEGSDEIDAELVAEITTNLCKIAEQVGFNPQSFQCLVQIICIIYKMAVDGDSFEEAKFFTRNAKHCSPKTLKKYRDIFDVDMLAKSFR